MNICLKKKNKKNPQWPFSLPLPCLQPSGLSTVLYSSRPSELWTSGLYFCLWLHVVIAGSVSSAFSLFSFFILSLEKLT